MSETLVPVDVIGVGLAVAIPQAQPVSPEMVLVLRESSGRRRWLPIAISPPEARAISDARGTADVPPSGASGVVTALLDALDRTIRRVELTDLHDTEFVTELVFDNDRRVQVRPSDAVALALSAGPMPMLVAEHVLDAAGTTSEMCASDEQADHDDEVERFRAFLDAVAPQDFDDSQR